MVKTHSIPDSFIVYLQPQLRRINGRACSQAPDFVVATTFKQVDVTGQKHSSKEIFNLGGILKPLENDNGVEDKDRGLV